MRQLFIFLFITVFISANGQFISKLDCQQKKIENGRAQNDEMYTFVLIPSIKGTWGYNILKNKKLFIHQTSIPGIIGNEAFKTKSDAQKVARLVIEKLKKGEMPPSVSEDELKKLNIIVNN